MARHRSDGVPDPARPEPDGAPDPGPGKWSDLVERARAVLVEVAARGTTLTYAELREQLGVELPHRGEHDLAALLRAASLAEEGTGRGLVSAVVVGTSGRPGAGWFRLAAEMGRDVTNPDATWRAERSRLEGAS